MSKTLGYTVQRVLEKLDLDVVNSINDSQDAILIAREAEDTFYDLVNRSEWPKNKTLIKMNSVSDVNNPTCLQISEDTLYIEDFRYNVATSTDTDANFRKLEQLSNEDFMTLTLSRSDSDSDTTTATYNGVEFYVYNNQAPRYFTLFDNEYVIMDSWYETEESTVAGSKSICTGTVAPTFEVDDDYVIPMDKKMYPLFLSELTAAASMALTGVPAMEEERRRFRAISRLRRKDSKIGMRDHRNNFGRHGTGRS